MTDTHTLYTIRDSPDCQIGKHGLAKRVKTLVESERRLWNTVENICVIPYKNSELRQPSAHRPFLSYYLPQCPPPKLLVSISAQPTRELLSSLPSPLVFSLNPSHSVALVSGKTIALKSSPTTRVTAPPRRMSLSRRVSA